MNKKQIIEGLKHKPYDFIANNYYQLTKEELKDIILELLACRDFEVYNIAQCELIENLINVRDWGND